MGKQVKKILFEKLLRKDFVQSSIVIKYFENTFEVIQIIINNYEFGTIEISNNQKETHCWENENQAESVSYLQRRYTSILLNGEVKDPTFEDDLIFSVKRDIVKSKTSKLKPIYLEILNEVKNGNYSLNLEKYKNLGI